MDVEEFKKWAEQIMQFIFTKSQENLVTPMPWGDKNFSSTRKPTAISDTGFLLRSGVPPFWEGNKIKIKYTAPWSEDVEFGCFDKETKILTKRGWLYFNKLKREDIVMTFIPDTNFL